MNQDLHAAIQGAWAGAVATLPMSGVMLASEKLGWMGEHPPDVIMDKGLRRTGIHVGQRTENSLAFTGHLAFGACAGAIFSVLSHRLARRSTTFVAQGIAYGLLVYTVSYQGLLPSVHIFPAPEHDRPGRQPSMAAAHVVYGAVLGALSVRGKQRRAQPTFAKSRALDVQKPRGDRGPQLFR